VKRGDAHEEDGRARRVDVVVHPARPRRQHLPIRLDPHDLVMLLPALPARSHDLHVEGVHPPDVGVEDEVVDAAPVLCVRRDRVRLDDPVLDAVDLGVVGVGLHQERRPVELHRRVVLLHARTHASRQFRTQQATTTHYQKPTRRLIEHKLVHRF
jgi:hypothetical protein